MSQPPETPSEKQEEKTGTLPETIPNDPLFVYNLDDSKTPGGIKIRWKVRVVTGDRARRYDARQAEAIRELLTWSRHHRPQDPSR